MEPWSGGYVDQWSQIRITLMRSRIRIWIRIKVKRGIRIRFLVKRWIPNPDPHYIKVMRIRNPYAKASYLRKLPKCSDWCSELSADGRWQEGEEIELSGDSEN